MALQALAPVHQGVDNVNVVRHVSHIFSGVSRRRPLELCTDGDLLILIADLICKRGHADDCMVRDGRVRALDKAGHDLADRAADLGRRRLPAGIINAARLCTAACREWYPIVFYLHRFFIATACVVVNVDGHNGSAPYPNVWDWGAKPKRRRVLQAVSEFAWVPGPLGGMVRLAGLVSTLMLLKLLLGLSLLVCSLSCVLFLGSLHLPAVVDDLGPAGVSYAGDAHL